MNKQQQHSGLSSQLVAVALITAAIIGVIAGIFSM